MTTGYNLLLISSIPVYENDNGYCTLDIWSRDINTNSQFVNEIKLLCPIAQMADPSITTTALDPRISVQDVSLLQSTALDELVRNADVVQVPGNFIWKQSRLSRTALRCANKHNKMSIVSISSNRAKTNVMNARGKGILRVLKSWAVYTSIRCSQTWLARHSNGVMLVGNGLVPLVKRHARNIHVGIASWISQEEICKAPTKQNSPISIVIASRLEAMKGVSIGVKAVAHLGNHSNIRLSIIGLGPEEEHLRNLVKELNIDEITKFEGQLSYPDDFLKRIRETDFVLLTNLNDEQPRLIFDVISQGAVPLCPKNCAYMNLDLDPMQFYEQGNYTALAIALQKLIDMNEIERFNLNAKLYKLAHVRTIEDMHDRRQKWISSLLLSTKGIHDNTVDSVK